MREEVKRHEPYVVPCLDMSRARIDREDDLYLHSIPYMQFPILLAGRPFTGERAAIPGIEYQPEETDFWTRHLRNIWRHYQAHPEGPYSYGWWDSASGRPEARPTYYKWLRLYRPMVEEGTWAYVDIADSDLFTKPPDPAIVASVFANVRMYVVLANYGRSESSVTTATPYVRAGSTGETASREWKLPARSLLILERPRSA